MWGPAAIDRPTGSGGRVESLALPPPQGSDFPPICTGRRAAKQASVAPGPIEKPQCASAASALLDPRGVFLRDERGKGPRNRSNEAVRVLDMLTFHNAQTISAHDDFVVTRVTRQKLV